MEARQKAKGPKHDNQNRISSHMPEREHFRYFFIPFNHYRQVRCMYI